MDPLVLSLSSYPCPDHTRARARSRSAVIHMPDRAICIKPCDENDINMLQKAQNTTNLRSWDPSYMPIQIHGIHNLDSGDEREPS